MANLLPTKELLALKLEQRRRLRAAIFVLISGLCLFGTVLLVPSVVVLLASRESTLQRLETTKKLIDLQKDANAGTMVASTKEKMDIVSQNESLLAPHALIDRVVGLLPAGVTLNEISFAREGVQVTLQLSGKAAQRNELIAFGDALKGTAFFTGVTIPIESLAKSTDLQFHLTLTLAENASSL